MAILCASTMCFGGCRNISTEQSDTSSKAPSTTSVESKASTPDSQNDQSSGQNSSSQPISPAVWIVTNDDGAYFYCMGSIHVGDSTLNAMPDYFEYAFNDSTALSVEVDVSEVTSDLNSALELMGKLVYTNGDTIKDHLSEDTYSRLVTILEANNMYSPLYDSYKPIMWESLMQKLIISKTGLDALAGVDVTVTDRAKKAGKVIYEVESMDTQIQAFDSLSDDLTELLLAAYTEEGAIESEAAATQQLYEKWKVGEINANDVISEFDSEKLTDEQKALVEEYQDKLLTQRNLGMTEQAESYFTDENTVMLLVGIGHFLGNDSILAHLEADGYTVTRLTSENYTGVIPGYTEPETTAAESSEDSVTSESENASENEYSSESDNSSESKNSSEIERNQPSGVSYIAA